MVYPKKLAYSSLDNKSITTFSRELVSLFTSFEEDSFVTRQCTGLESLTGEMDLGFSRTVKSQFTGDISSLEEKKKSN